MLPVNTATSTDALHDTPASPLLEKAGRLGLQLPLDLERLAIARGCDYYERELSPRTPPVGDVPLSNAELAIALLTPSGTPTAREIRLAAAQLGGLDMSAEQVASLAVQEHCAESVQYIAECGRRFEPQNRFWPTLLDHLPKVSVAPDRLPHPTRFVEMTGIDRGKVGVLTRWIRPRNPVAA